MTPTTIPTSQSYIWKKTYFNNLLTGDTQTHIHTQFDSHVFSSSKWISSSSFWLILSIDTLRLFVCCFVYISFECHFRDEKKTACIQIQPLGIRYNNNKKK